MCSSSREPPSFQTNWLQHGHEKLSLGELVFISIKKKWPLGSCIISRFQVHVTGIFSLVMGLRAGHKADQISNLMVASTNFRQRTEKLGCTLILAFVLMK